MGTTDVRDEMFLRLHLFPAKQTCQSIYVLPQLVLEVDPCIVDVEVRPTYNTIWN